MTFSEHIVGVSDNFEGPPQTVESFCSEPQQVAGAPECTQRNCSIRFPGQADFQFITFFNCDTEIFVADPEVAGLGTPVFDAQSMYDACLSIPTTQLDNQISTRAAQDRQDYRDQIEETGWAMAGTLGLGLVLTPLSAAFAPSLTPMIARGTIVTPTLQAVQATYLAVKDKWFPSRKTYRFALDEGCKLLQAEKHCYIEATTAFPFDSLPQKDENALKALVESVGAHGPTVWEHCNRGSATP